MKHLVIVESPNKIESIEKYLGSDFTVLASKGHIAKLPSSGEFNFGIDLATWTPRYKIDPTKSAIVKELKAAAAKSDIVYVATDPDREGEAIADHLITYLGIEKKYKRIRFNEITKEAVNLAVQNPTELNVKLVESQTARRILDRVIGYRLSDFLKGKVKSAPSTVSAGRVQSVALKLVVDRELEIESFIPVVYFDLEAQIKGYPDVVASYYNPENEDNKGWIKPEVVESIRASLKGSLEVMEIETSKRNETKYTPLKQSAMYKKADSALGLSASRVTSAMQRLYEGYGDGGLISYPRTDSTRLSDTFVKAGQAYILSRYGEDYVAKEVKGSAGAQDAHEAIRPTSLSLTPSQANARFNLKSDEAKVYELIWTHTMQCLMSTPVKELIRYELKDGDHQFRMTSSKVLFDGYYIVTGYEAKKELPKFSKGEVLGVEKYNFEEHSTQPPARYNDGSLIEKLDEIGVGRPSTFATTVNTLKEREYVTLDGKAFKLTDVGRIVYDKLLGGFPEIINETYTAKMEEELDGIADGNYERNQVLDQFWKPFQKTLENATMEIQVTQVVQLPTGKFCPNCGAELVVRTNKRDGTKFFACPNFPKCRHTESDPNAKRPFRKFYKKKEA